MQYCCISVAHKEFKDLISENSIVLDFCNASIINVSKEFLGGLKCQFYQILIRSINLFGAIILHDCWVQKFLGFTLMPMYDNFLLSISSIRKSTSRNISYTIGKVIV